MRGLFLFSPSALDYGQRWLFVTPAQIWRHERKSRVDQFAKADTLDYDHQSQNILGIGPLKPPYPVALTITSAYGTVVPAIVKWSSVMKSTPQRLHLNTLTSGSSSTPGIVRATTIGREQFGQTGDWACIVVLPGRAHVSLVGCNAAPA